MNKELPIIGWFSCGATSAVACKIGLSMYENVRIVHIETGSEHSDNKRFLIDCQKWFGVEIQTIRSGKFDNVEDVLLKKKYINGPTGASCTKELKKQVRYLYEEALGEWGGQIWGFDFCKDEINRAIRFKQQNPKTKPLFPLIERHLTKQDCLGILKKAGIAIPIMYKLGYNNNNCIGCVKGGIGSHGIHPYQQICRRVQWTPLLSGMQVHCETKQRPSAYISHIYGEIGAGGYPLIENSRKWQTLCRKRCVQGN